MKKLIKKLIKDWILPIAIALVIAFIMRQFVFFIAFVPTNSMEETIMPGERLFVTRIYNFEKLKRGDIIVFYSDEAGAVFIKRLIGLPGDRIKIIDGELFINGEKISEPYVKNKDTKTYFDSEEIVVPDNSYFFLGDNRVASYDSRYWSPPFVSEEYIKGKAHMAIFPFNRIRLLKN